MAEHTTEVVGELAEQIGEGAGMPQLDFATYPNQIFWLAVSLIIVFFILSRVVLPRVSSVLAERQGTITNDIATADELKQKAVEAEEAYLKALADARGEAGRIVAEAKAEIQAELDVAIAKADAEIAAKAAESEAAIGEIRKGALKAVETVAKSTAGEIIKSVMPGAGDAKAVTAAIKSQLKGA